MCRLHPFSKQNARPLRTRNGKRLRRNRPNILAHKPINVIIEWHSFEAGCRGRCGYYPTNQRVVALAESEISVVEPCRTRRANRLDSFADSVKLRVCSPVISSPHGLALLQALRGSPTHIGVLSGLRQIGETPHKRRKRWKNFAESTGHRNVLLSATKAKIRMMRRI